MSEEEDGGNQVGRANHAPCAVGWSRGGLLLVGLLARKPMALTMSTQNDQYSGGGGGDGGGLFSSCLCDVTAHTYHICLLEIPSQRVPVQ